MSDPRLAIAGFYDQHHDDDGRAPDWGGDAVFAPAVRRQRRTVTITGRPEGIARRPSRTLDERVAHRPDRIASWTCAMGFLLILLAILTAH